MEIRKVSALRGPNLWANITVLEALVDLQEEKHARSHEMAGFHDRLIAWFPAGADGAGGSAASTHICERLRHGADLAQVLDHLTRELQKLAGTPVHFGHTAPLAEDGVYKVVVEYFEEKIARACLEVAHGMCLAAAGNLLFDAAGEIERLRELAHEIRMGPSTASIVNAARARGVPFRRLTDGSLVVLGHGARQRKILTAETDRTSAIAQEIAQDKDLTCALLRAAGVPVPKGRPVSSAEDAWSAAQEVGTPVVVKPRYGNQGRGVTTDLTTREQVIAAYENALRVGEGTVVETCAPGSDFRLLVVGDHVVAAACREPAQVVGDGHSTIRALIEVINCDPRRADHHATALSKIYIDGVALGVLEEQGYTPDSIPPAGKRVLIRRNANLSTGGTATDVTELVHPEVAARAVDAARMVGLDIAGVDIVAEDISRPLEEQRGAVIEVNAGPGLRMHLEPSAGTPRPVGEAIADLLFPNGESGRIPIVAVTGVNGKTTTTRLVAHILRQSGKHVGMTCTDGIYMDQRRIDEGDCSGPQSARSVLLNPMVEAAVLETARGGVLREGLGFDRCHVAIVTNIGLGDHLGISGIETIQQLADVKRKIVDVVLPEGTAVLNADDPLVVSMAARCEGSVTFFARDGRRPVILEHRARGGRALFVNEGAIVLAEGNSERVLVSLARVPLTSRGRIAFQVENVLAAAAAAWALGIPDDTVRAALATFASDTRQVPGRFNVLEADGATVVIDYAHNVSAVEALINALEEFPAERRSILFTAAGDRRDDDIVQQGALLAEAFDRIYLYEDNCTRGRADGEVIALLRRGIGSVSGPVEVAETRGETATVRLALHQLEPGDLLVIQPDRVDHTVELIERLLAAGLRSRPQAEMELVGAPAAGYSPTTWPRGMVLIQD
jgi:cyanophycin synthetase